MLKILVLRLNERKFEKIEAETLERLCRRLLQGNSAFIKLVSLNDDLSFDNKEIYDVVIFIKSTVLITHNTSDMLSMKVFNARIFETVSPVCNEARIEAQIASPPFIYLTPELFVRAVEDFYSAHSADLIKVPEIDNFCFAMRWQTFIDLISNYDVKTIFDKINSLGLRHSICKNLYVHQYSDCYENKRDDILHHVPLSAKKILDIGCAKGHFGMLLKQRQRCTVTGVDINEELIKTAQTRLDKVIVGNIESIVGSDLLDVYDTVICSDVLEHLIDPWTFVNKMKTHIEKNGLFISSIPNVCNWAIIHEMLNGRWDYAPFSILSGSHLRFFTKRTVTEMFEDAGYNIKGIFTQSLDLPKVGAKFIQKLKGLFNEIDEDNLLCAQIIVVAEA